MDKEYYVNIPEENFRVVEFVQDDLPGIAMVNQSLTGFEPKEVFAWHCSIMIICDDLVDNRMPSEKEVEILEEFGDFLNRNIKGESEENPNALFLANITWNESRELIWRVYDPEPTIQFLTDLIERDDHIREFDYRIDPDEEWELADWHLMAND